MVICTYFSHNLHRTQPYKSPFDTRHTQLKSPKLPPIQLFAIIKHNQYDLGGIIHTYTITPFWHKRICEAAIIISAVAVLLFAWQNLFPQDVVSIALSVSHLTALGGALLVVAGSIAYGKTPEQYMTTVSTTLYLASVALLGLLLFDTNSVTSPLIALWPLVAIFSGLFGWWGIGGMLLLANGFLISGFFMLSLGKLEVIVAALALELPVLISYMLWHGNSSLFATNTNHGEKLTNSLKNEAAKSNTIIRSISDGVIMVNPAQEITLINPAAQTLTGWSAADALKLHLSSVLIIEDETGAQFSEATNPLTQALQQLQTSRYTAVVVTKSGKRVTSAFSITPLKDGGAIIIFRDITKERAEEREQAEFISTASHEMRTPVASIEGFLGLALTPQVATIDDKAREYITKAHDSAQYLGRLLQDLLEISRAEDGRLQHHMEMLELAEFTKTITESFQPKASEKQLSLIYKPAGTKASVGDTKIAPVLYGWADKDHLREALSNLIENAIKYTPTGEVTVDIHATNDTVRINVQDSGIGIPAEDVPHLFQKFYRVDNTDTREIGGSGLGLYLTRKLIEGMNGRIGVESILHKGSTFYIELPRVDRTQALAIIEEEKRRTARKMEYEQQVAEQTIIPEETQPAQPAAAPTATQPQPVLAPTPEPSTQPQPTPAPVVTPTPMPATPTPPQPAQPPTPPPATSRESFHITVPNPHPTTIQAPPLNYTPPAPPIVLPAEPDQPLAVPKQPDQPLIIPEIPTPQRPATPGKPTNERPNTPLSVLEQNSQNYLSKPPQPPNR